LHDFVQSQRPAAAGLLLNLFHPATPARDVESSAPGRPVKANLQNQNEDLLTPPRAFHQKKNSTANYADFTDKDASVVIFLLHIRGVRAIRGPNKNSLLCGALCPLCESPKIVDCQS
jgi:hypothetical protein